MPTSSHFSLVCTDELSSTTICLDVQGRLQMNARSHLGMQTRCPASGMAREAGAQRRFLRRVQKRIEELLGEQTALQERLAAEMAARAAAEVAVAGAAAEEAARAMRRQSDVGDRHAAPAVDGEVTFVSSFFLPVASPSPGT